MAQDLTKLASQGRAYSPSRAWTAEELEILLAIEASGEGVPRTVAAEFIRNGITSVEEYEAAIKAEFVPKSFADLQNDAVQDHIKSVRKELGLKEGEPEVVPELEVEAPAETEKVSEPEVVPEPETVKKAIAKTTKK